MRHWEVRLGSGQFRQFGAVSLAADPSEFGARVLVLSLESSSDVEEIEDVGEATREEELEIDLVSSECFVGDVEDVDPI